MDRSIGHAHFLVYGILVVSMSGLVSSSRGIAFPRKQTLTDTARNAGSKQRTTFQQGSDFRSMKNAQKYMFSIITHALLNFP